MKKALIVLLVLWIIAGIPSSCAASFPKKENVAALSSEEATNVLKGKTEKEIHDHWGEPDSMLSGFYGDIYVYNDKLIVIFYDDGEVVTDVLISDKQI